MLCGLFVKIDIIKNIETVTLRCQIVLYFELCVVFILRLVGRCRGWVCLPLCHLMLLFFFLFCYILHYDLWMCVSVMLY
jgi:uncharacterized membrane protein YqhA